MSQTNFTASFHTSVLRGHCFLYFDNQKNSCYLNVLEKRVANLMARKWAWSSIPTVVKLFFLRDLGAEPLKNCWRMRFGQ